MEFTLRPPVLPTEYPRIAELFSLTNPDPVSPEMLADEESRFPAGTIAYRQVAVDSTDYILGQGFAYHFPHEESGRFMVKVMVDPQYRRQGVGAALARAIDQFVTEHGGNWLETKVRDNDPVSLAFAERHGFRKNRQWFESVLNVPAFDESRFTGVVEQAEAAGIRFFSLADAPGEENERRLYSLIFERADDDPGNDSSPPDFETFHNGMLESAYSRRDCILIAADGDRWVGFTRVLTLEDKAGYNGGTGVDPDYRGRHLALALKLLSIRKAREVGLTHMRTNNDTENAPMLAINQKLGYVAAPGVYHMKRKD